MRYQCIDRHRNQYPVRMMCGALKVSRSGYYAWHTRPESDRGVTDRALTQAIQVIHRESKGVYGAQKYALNSRRKAITMDDTRSPD